MTERIGEAGSPDGAPPVPAGTDTASADPGPPAGPDATARPLQRRIERLSGRLGFRLGLLLSFALLPLGLVAVLQTGSTVREAEARSRAALMGETLLVVQTQLRSIQRARGLAEALAIAVRPIVDDAAQCSALMQSFAAEEREYSLVAFVPRNGRITCASTGGSYDVSADPAYERLLASSEPMFAVHPRGPVIGMAVVAVSHPVLDAGGETLGAVSVNVPHAAVNAPARAGDIAPPLSLAREDAALVTFNRDGDVLTSSRDEGTTSLLLPRNLPLTAFDGTQPQTFFARSLGNRERFYSVIPLVEGEHYALGTWPAEAYRADGLSGAPPFLFPALMWIASLFVGWMGASRLATHPIQKLRAAITAFADGNERVDTKALKSAPLEIRQLTEAFEGMTMTIVQDKAELENAIHQKEVLLREVHHRVKNNLQLIASILNMQMRRTRSEEAKWLMHGLRDRVMSLATIHRELYQTTGLTDIRADELLSDILRQVVKLGTGPGRSFAVRSHFDAITLTPDQAVPLSLLLTEALTNALKYAEGRGGRPAELEVRLDALEDARARLCIANSAGPPGHAEDDDGDPGTGIGSQLIEAFAQQIGGVLETDESDDEYRLIVTFDPRSEVPEDDDAPATDAPDPVETPPGHDAP